MLSRPQLPVVRREHKDLNLGYEDGEVRIHVPVRSNPGVEFVLDGREIEMEEGEACKSRPPP